MALFFFPLFTNALAFFRKHQRLPNVIQKCFSSFFRNEAVFDFLSISDGVPRGSEEMKRKKNHQMNCFIVTFNLRNLN